jgi:hypothetical protein
LFSSLSFVSFYARVPLSSLKLVELQRVEKKEEVEEVEEPPSQEILQVHDPDDSIPDHDGKNSNSSLDDKHFAPPVGNQRYRSKRT